MKLFHQEFGLQTHESWAMIKLKIGLRLKGVSVKVTTNPVVDVPMKRLALVFRRLIISESNDLKKSNFFYDFLADVWSRCAT